jgi:hypothetical protein
MTKDDLLEEAWNLVVTARQAHGGSDPMPKWEAAKLKWLKSYAELGRAAEPRGDVKGATFGCQKCGTTVTLEFTDATKKSVAIGPMNGWVVGPGGCFCPHCALNRT